MERVRGGRLGQVHLARTWITSVRPNIGHAAGHLSAARRSISISGPGPALDPHYKKNLVPYHWHWRWLYGTGECGNNGIHFLDLARWGLGVEAPQFVTCGGNRYHFDDDQETPDTQLATFDFNRAAIEWEHRTWSKHGEEGSPFGVVFYGTDATLVALENGWKIYHDRKVVEEHAGTGHARLGPSALSATFSIADRRGNRPVADIEIGPSQTSLCHLANIAWRTRSTLRFEGTTETIADNPAGTALLSREYRKGYQLPAIT